MHWAKKTSCLSLSSCAGASWRLACRSTGPACMSDAASSALWLWLELEPHRRIVRRGQVAEAALANDAYRRNPLFHVIEKGEAFRGRTHEAAQRYPLMAELARQGYVDYAAIPLRAGGAYHNAATVATKRVGGFSEAQFGDLTRSCGWPRFMSNATSRSGSPPTSWTPISARPPEDACCAARSSAVRGVHPGHHLGVGPARLHRPRRPSRRPRHDRPAERLLRVSRRAVLAHDGEVLKFIGDGLLAVFPYSAFADERAAAAAALSAAESALRAIERLNADRRPSPISPAGAPCEPESPCTTAKCSSAMSVRRSGWISRSSVGPSMPPAASRRSASRWALHRLTEPVMRLLDRPLEPLGEHALRGLAAPLSIYGVP